MANVIAWYSPKAFSFESSQKLLDICLAGSRILYFWYVLESTHKFTIELHSLQCFFLRRSNRKQRRDRIISNLSKGETFSSLLATKYSWGIILRCGFPTCTLQFGQEENIPGHSIENRAYWFILKVSRMFHTLISRNWMMNTFIIVNIIPTC